MRADELATAGLIDQYLRPIHELLSRLQPAPAQAADVVLYTVAKLAAVLEVHPETVRSWITTGKKGKDGTRIKLQVFRFTHEARIPWPAALAYERGEDFDLATLPAPLLPPAELEPAPLPKLTDPGIPPVLRVA